MAIEGGRFDFDDGGSYVGEWSEGRAHGLGIATGPDNQGEYSGEWAQGFENRGVYIWPSGNMYAGTWLKGKRHGEGVQVKGRWMYRGQFTTGFCGRYGVKESLTSCAKYEGSWHLNQFDGFGVETNSDGSMYAGAWAKGMRQGLGIRTSAPYGVAAEQHKTMRAAQSQNSLPSAAGSDLHWRGPGSSGGGSGAGVDIIGGDRMGRTDEIRSGFVLRSSSAGPVETGQSYSNFFSSGQRSAGGFFRNPFDRSNKPKSRSGSLRNLFSRKLKKQKSTGDLMSIGAQTTIGATSGSAEAVAKANNRAGGSLKSNFSGNSKISALSYTAARHASAGLPFAHQKDSVAAQLAIARRNFDEPSAPNVTETYAGQWNEDRRSGYGQAERSDGLRYEGEWFNNKKDGYGCTYFPDGTKEEGRYKENIIVQCLNRKSRLFMIRHTRLRDFVEEAVKKAQEAAREAKEKSADTAHQRAQTARTVAKKAETKARMARILSDHARSVSEEFDPDFVQLGLIWEKQNPLIGPDMFGGPISEEDLEDPTLFGEFAGTNSPSMNRQAQNGQEAKGDYLNAKSLQVSGSRRGSFRSSFRRNQSYKQSLAGSENPSESAQHGNTLVLPAQVSPGLNSQSDTKLQDFQVSVPPIKSPKQQDSLVPPLQSPNTLPKLTIDVPAPSDEPLTNELPLLDPDKHEQMKKQLEQGVIDVKERLRKKEKENVHANFVPPKRDFDQMSLDQARMQSLGNDSRFDQSKAGMSSSRHTLNLGAELAGTESRFEQLQLLNRKIAGPGTLKTGRNPAGRPMSRAATSDFGGRNDVIGKFSQFAFQHPHSQYLMLDEMEEPLQEQKTQQTVSRTDEAVNERRRTLPNIMTEPPIKALSPGSLIHHEVDAEEAAKVNSFTPDDTYIIEDGLRKRLHFDKPRSDSPNQRIASSKYPNAIPGVPPPSYQAHENAKRSHGGSREILLGNEEKMLPGVYMEEFNRGLMRESSMPDIAGTLHTAANRNMGVKLVGISREEVSKMSQARRQELLEESKWRSRNEIVIRLADIKEWFRTNFIFVLVFLLNATLAFLFINLLSSTSQTPSVSNLVDESEATDGATGENGGGELKKVVHEAGKAILKTVKKAAKKKAKVK